MRKSNVIFRRLCAALCLPLALLLTGCGTGARSFTWFLEELPANLDPQIAQTNADIVACTNLYSGLVRRGPDGALQNDLCQSYTISPDGLTYTFTLKDGLTYVASRGEATDYAITAEDFVFAFRRMFRPETRSPYAANFLALQNSEAVLAREMDVSALGVAAPDPLTLVFTLREPDPSFLTKLTLPGAMPCDEEFFASTAGTYGLTMKSTLSSGPFYLYNWTGGGLFLRRAVPEPLVDSLRLVQNTNAAAAAPEQLILNERCSAIPDTAMTPTNLPSQTYTDTTWCLVFNCRTVLQNAALRQALTACVGEQQFVQSGLLYGPAAGLIPTGAAVDGQDYRAAAGTLRPATADPAALYAQVLEQLTPAQLKGITLLLPAEAGLTEAAAALNSRWQQEFSLFFSLEEAGAEAFAQRLEDGAFTIAIAPLQMIDRDPAAMLEALTEAPAGYDDETFAALLAQARHTTGAARLQALIRAERRAVEQCAVVPLYSQNKRLLTASGIRGLVFDPYGPIVDLTYTELG